MQVSSSFKNIKHTPGIDEHIYEESEKLAKFFDGKFEVQWSCHLRNGVNITHVKLFGPHFEYFATAESGNLFKSINKATIKLQKQLQNKDLQELPLRWVLHFRGKMPIFPLQRGVAFSRHLVTQGRENHSKIEHSQV